MGGLDDLVRRCFCIHLAWRQGVKRAVRFRENYFTAEIRSRGELTVFMSKEYLETNTLESFNSPVWMNPLCDVILASPKPLLCLFFFWCTHLHTSLPVSH